MAKEAEGMQDEVSEKLKREEKKLKSYLYNQQQELRNYKMEQRSGFSADKGKGNYSLGLPN